MKITGVKTVYVEIPLEKPFTFATGSLKHRQYVIVAIETDAGIVGEGYTFALYNGAVIRCQIERRLKDVLLGEDPLFHERLWEEMFRANYYDGRHGTLMRAISAVDIALWDIKCKAANLPLHKLLGASRTRIPAYASAGGYHEKNELRILAEESAACVEDGFRAIKVRVGKRSAENDRERVAATRAAIGDGVELMVDAVNVWKTAKEAIKVARLIEEYEIRFFEEPVPGDNWPALVDIKAGIDIPLAAGETGSGRWAYRDLLVNDAVDIIQPDVTAVGGISEWLKIAGLAACFDTPLAPHRASEVHAQLAAATPHAEILEYHAPSQKGLVVFDRILKEPLTFREGLVEVPDTVGAGVAFDWEAVARYAV
jgi:D-arabinonate dehydratase